MQRNAGVYPRAIAAPEQLSEGCTESSPTSLYVGNIHGLNEYVGVKSLLEGRDFLYRLIKIYAEAT